MQRQLFSNELLPFAPLPNDVVTCADGTQVERQYAYEDCQGNYHATSDERHAANVQIVSDLLAKVNDDASGYYTENVDYPNSYTAGECRSTAINDAIREWVEENVDVEGYLPDRSEYECGEDYELDARDKVDDITDYLDRHVDYDFAEPVYHPCEYAGYSGPGVCIDGFDIGEVEEQIDLTCFDELYRLHVSGDLDDVLDDINCDVIVYRRKRREQIDGKYCEVGRETYNPYNQDNPTLTLVVYPGGRWDFVLSDEYLQDILKEFLDSEDS